MQKRTWAHAGRALGTTLFAVLLWLVAPHPADADAPFDRHQLRLEVGLGLPLGSVDRELLRPGLAFGGGYVFRPHRYVSVSPRYTGMLLGFKGPGGGFATYHALGANVRVHPLPSMDLGDLWIGIGPQFVRSGNVNRFSLSADAGFDIRLHPRIALGPYARYHHVFQPQTAGRDQDAHLLEVGVGLAIRLDRSTQEVEVEVEAEEVDAPVEEATPAPVEPEEPADPCAPNDSGVITDPSCPGYDSDSDGIPDSSDACVDEPETANGFEDADGCPDEAPAAAVEPPVVAPSIELPEALLFTKNSARVASRYRASLRRLARALASSPGSILVLDGHADASGEAHFNDELSTQRAAAVRDALVRMGVPAEQIEYAGHGSRQPTDDGAGEAAARRNRRVEFSIR